MVEEFWLLVPGASTFIISTLSIISFQQLCHTDIDDKIRLRKVSWVCVVCINAIILNILIYSKYMWQDQQLIYRLTVEDITNIFEAFAMIITFHVLVMFVLSLIDKLHSKLNISTPKPLKYLFYALQTVIILMVLICYSFSYIFADITWMHIFHITLAIVIFIQSLFILSSLIKLLRILRKVKNKIIAKKIASARKGIQAGIAVSILIFGVCAADIALTVLFLFGWNGINGVDADDRSKNMIFANCIMHSLFSTLICLALNMAIYQQHDWCFIDNTHSVCMVYGCGDFWSFVCSCCCRDYLDQFYAMDDRERRINALWKDMYAEKKASGKLDVQLLNEKGYQQQRRQHLMSGTDDENSQNTTTAEMTPIPHNI